MKLKNLILAYIIINSVFLSGASANYRQELSASFAFMLSSFTENNSAQETGSETAPQSGSTSQLSLDINWKFFSTPDRNYFVSGTVPFLNSSQTGMFAFNAGINFFLFSNSTTLESKFLGSKITITPEWRFYWGPNVGVRYHIYSTEIADKSDTLFDIGVHGGAIYNIAKDWGIVAQGNLTKGTGVGTTDINLKFVIGGTYFLDLE